MVTLEAITAFIAKAFPQAQCHVIKVGNGSATISREIGQAELRPGGTVSGPVLMAVADEALYIALLATIGLVPLAVTTSFNINFLRKPAADARILAECRLIKVGRTLAVGEVSLYSEGHAEMVAHATGTYSIPPNRDRPT